MGEDCLSCLTCVLSFCLLNNKICLKYLCEDRLPKFTESYFQVSCMRDCNTEFDETSVDKSNTPESDTTINNTSGVNNEEEKSVFECLRESRKLHPRNFTTAYININSIHNKYDEIKELLSDKIVDLLFIAEIKLDQSFNDNLFQNDGYKLFRQDRNCHGGGIMAQVNIDFPSSRKGNLESKNMENISI